MLTWLRRVFGLQDAAQTPKRHNPTFVTDEQLELRLVEYTKEREWEWDDTLGKIKTFHARLAKRDARADAPPPNAAQDNSELGLYARARQAGLLRS